MRLKHCAEGTKSAKTAMKKLLSRALSKPAEHREENEGPSPLRATSLPVRRLQPSPQQSFVCESTTFNDSETGCSTISTQRGVTNTCTNEHCQSLIARLQRQLQNLREEKLQLESLIHMQQKTLHLIDQEGRTSEELAARQLKVQQKLALVLQDEKASIEDKLKSSADAIQSLNEQVTTLRQLLTEKNEEVEKLHSDLEVLRKGDTQLVRGSLKEDTAIGALLIAALQSNDSASSELEEGAGTTEPLMRRGSPDKLASLITRNTELVDELAEKEQSVLTLKRQLTETQAQAEEVAKEKDEQLQSMSKRLAELEVQATKAQALLCLGSPEKLQSLIAKNAELAGELAEKDESVTTLKRQLTETQAHAEEAAKEKEAELLSMQNRLAELNEQALKAETLLRHGSPEKLASLVSRNAELLGELAEKEESVSALKRQLKKTQAEAEEAANEKESELQSLRERFAKLEKRAGEAEPLLRFGSPEKLASLVLRNAELVGELAEKEESVSTLKRQLTDTQAEAEEAAKENAAELERLRGRLAELEDQAANEKPLVRFSWQTIFFGSDVPHEVVRFQRLDLNDAAKKKDAELQSLRTRLAELEEQAIKAESLLRLGSPEKLASLVSRNTELVGELAEKQESLSCLQRQLTETRAHAEIVTGLQEAVKRKDAEMQSMRTRLVELEEQATNAEPLLRLGSPEKLASLVTRNVRVTHPPIEQMNFFKTADLVSELAEKEESLSTLKRHLTETQAQAEETAKEKDAELESLRRRLAEMEEQATRAEPLMRLGSPEKLATLLRRNLSTRAMLQQRMQTELADELAEKEESVAALKRQLTETQAHAQEVSKDKDAELQTLRRRLAELEEQASQAERVAHPDSTRNADSLATRNAELVVELAEKDERMSALKRQLTEAQALSEDVAKEKEAELQSLRERLAELEERATKAEPLTRLGSPDKLASLVSRNTELVGELAEKEESLAVLKRQLTETQAHAEEELKDKDVELQALRTRLAEVEEQALNAEALMRLGSPGKMESLVTRNVELVRELAAQEESVAALKRQLTETQKVAKEKNAELQSTQKRLAELEEQAEGRSSSRMALLVPRNVELASDLAVEEKDTDLPKSQLREPQRLIKASTALTLVRAEGRRLEASSASGINSFQKGPSELEDPEKSGVAEGEVKYSAKSSREAHEVELRLQEQLQQMQCELESMKKENYALKETLMNTAQQSVDKDCVILRDKRDYDNMKRDLQVATRGTQDCKHLLQMERERRIAQVTRLKKELAEAQQKMREQQLLSPLRKGQHPQADHSGRGALSQLNGRALHETPEESVGSGDPKSFESPVDVGRSLLSETVLSHRLNRQDSGSVAQLLRVFDSHKRNGRDLFLESSCPRF
ncbi:hypothetical protein Efla_001190 [Eimeria flavescens]